MNDKDRVVKRLIGEKKYLWCQKCKCYPDIIREEYQEAIVETRKWDGDCYAIEETNFDNVEFIEFCDECDTKLENRE